MDLLPMQGQLQNWLKPRQPEQKNPELPKKTGN